MKRLSPISQRAVDGLNGWLEGRAPQSPGLRPPSCPLSGGGSSAVGSPSTPPSAGGLGRPRAAAGHFPDTGFPGQEDEAGSPRLRSD